MWGTATEDFNVGCVIDCKILLRYRFSRKLYGVKLHYIPRELLGSLLKLIQSFLQGKNVLTVSSRGSVLCA